MAELDLGRIRFFDKGKHSMETEYVLWDFVTGNGSTYLYINKANSTGKPLTDEFYWKCLAKRGLSAFEVWDIMNGGDKTEAQFFDFIQSPANDAKDDYYDVVKPAIQAQGVYAQAQGDYAKAQGEAVEGNVSDLQVKTTKIQQEVKQNQETLSTINSNQEAKQSIEGTSPLNLPINTGEGNAQFNLKGLTATNLIENGDFRNGLDKWIRTDNAVISDGVAVVNETPAYLQQKINFNQTSKYYLSVLSSAVNVDAGLAVSLVSMNTFKETLIQLNSENSELKDRSIIFTVNDASIDGISLNRSGVLTTGYFTFADYRLIDLTQTFGAGNEPTKEWCDEHFPNYFKGTQSVDAPVRIKSVGKNLFDYLNVRFTTSLGLNTDGVSLGNGEFILDVNTHGVGVSSMAIPCLKTTYTLQANFRALEGTPNYRFSVIALDANKNILTSGISNLNYSASYNGFLSSGILTTDGTFSTPIEISSDSVKYLEVKAMGHVAGTINKVKISNIQLEENTVETSYEPYIKNHLYIDNNTKLRSLPNGVKDEIRPDGKGGYEMVKRISDLGVELAEPIITPLITSGSLISRPNGTVSVEQIVANAGVYTTKYDVTIPTLRIKSIESITKIDFETAQETKLNVEDAVINDSSFTHPNLTNGDIVFVVYEYQNDSLNAPLKVDYYDSRYTVKDSVTDTFYKWSITVADGVPTINLTPA